MRVAIIPARGGSKRIPRKNIKPFFGQAMIGYSIKAALGSSLFDKVIVSTDDPEIAEVAISFGADVPFVRPLTLSDDHTGTGPVVVHAIDWLLQHAHTPKAVCCIYATAPFLKPERLREGWEKLQGKRFSFSVTEYAFPIQRALRQTNTGSVEMFWPENLTKRSQDLEPAFHDAGQFYWGWSEAWLKGEITFSDISAPVILPRTEVVDIDTQEDWDVAENLFAALYQRPEL
jgi:pseudaminic acid cytidylyltransferase